MLKQQKKVLVLRSEMGIASVPLARRNRSRCIVTRGFGVSVWKANATLTISVALFAELSEL